ncbi:MAG: aldose 1-epimerase [Planctomycetaceae bacterium]|nr:aldose 1-epimerase [Planctomycetaceae bacterium]
MPAITIKDDASGSQAQVLPELGFNLFQFSVPLKSTTIEVIDAPADFAEGKERPSRYGIPILFPFPNRIKGGAYSWAGKDYQLPVPKPGAHAIHGFCLDRPWRVIDQTENTVTGEFQLSKDAPERLELWPSDFVIRCTYLVRGNRLRSRFEFHNPGTEPLPWGFGTHAYFRVPLTDASSVEHCLMVAPAFEQWPLNDFIPTGERIPVTGANNLTEGAYVTELKLDDVLTGLTPDKDALRCRIMDEGSGYQLVQECDLRFRELVVFTPPNRNAVCMEPYTCPTDAINLTARGIECGWEVLDPGKSATTWIDLCVEPIMA